MVLCLFTAISQREEQSHNTKGQTGDPERSFHSQRAHTGCYSEEGRLLAVFQVGSLEFAKEVLFFFFLNKKRSAFLLSYPL